MIKVLRLKDIGIFKGGLTYSPENICDKEEGILVLRSSNIQNSKISLLDNVYVNCEVSSDLLIKKGDLLICSRNGSANLVGKTAQIEDDIHATWGAFMMIFRTSYNSRYTYYLLNDSITKNKGLFSTSTINQLTNSMLGNIYVNFELDISAQEKIARYLDTKVGEIDQKVSLIEKKIERYQLLKKSIINKVVTKGLHPEAPLKDSQISWLGQIPEHWEVKRIKDIISLVFMGTSPSYEYEVENENYVFGQRNNQLYKIDFNGLKHATNEFFNSRSEYEYLTYGDVIINTLGGGSVGRVGYFDYLGDMRMITDGHVMILRSNSYSTKFLYYYLHSKRRELENLASGSTNQSFFNISDIVVLYLPAPPLSEQQEIASYLDQKCADIDAIIANCTAQIEKYKTLKRALINEVVTGQRAIE
jgi:type I restriction enzyme S subunit